MKRNLPFYLLLSSIVLAVFLNAQGNKPKEEYRYFYKAQIGIPEWSRSTDTLQLLLQNFGRSLSVDQAEQYRALFIRQINKIQFSVDSVKVEGGKK